MDVDPMRFGGRRSGLRGGGAAGETGHAQGGRGDAAGEEISPVQQGRGYSGVGATGAP
jgi:hypothetical protein